MYGLLYECKFLTIEETKKKKKKKKKTHTSLSPIRRGFSPSFANFKKGCTRLAAASDKVYELLAHDR
jgi:hypothetical protein